jgi:hypothetical protein
MILASAGTLALLAQAATLAAHPAPKAAPVRVWIADSTVYVRLRDPGYLTVLHVDPVGRIRVLFPFNPDDNAAAAGGATFQLAAPLGAESGTATIVAARSSRPLQVAGLRAGPFWDYGSGMLFQPTAGNGVAALLDIADRMADGGAFDFDVTTYRIGRGPLAARDPQLTTPVCLTCVRSYAVEQQSTVAIDQSNSVDCSSANLVNSFCGVVDNRVTNTYVYNEVAAAPEPVYVPYYVPIFIRPRRRVSQPPPPPPQRTLAIVSPLQRVSGPVVPPPPRRKFVIDVQQPRQQRYAPIEPRQREAPAVLSALPPGPRAVAPAAPRVVHWGSAAMPARASVSWQPATPQRPEVAAPTPEPMHGTLSLPATHAWRSVPSSAVLRSIRARPH